MQFDDLKNEVKGISIGDLRKDSQSYFEAVIAKEELAKLLTKLEKFLGLPVWPSKTKLSTAIQNAIEEFGGIRPGQTLYFSHLDSTTVFAMLWPWGDGTRITLKIFKE